VTIEVRQARKAYAGRRRGEPVVALDGVDLDIAAGELLAVVGPSGSGKTTLLRVVAGLELLDSGVVRVGGRDVTALPPGDRDVAMVFQEGALYPHLSVEANISFGIRARGAGKAAAAERARAAAAALSVDGLLDRRPAQLSGGERRRVALARAIVREPAAFLLDEPLAALDPELRARARREIGDLQRRLGVAMVYVTHDTTEAMSLGDRVAVLRAGRLVQVDTPTAVYDRPADPFVARLFGSLPMNVFPASLLGDGPGVAGVRPERVALLSPEDGRLRGRVTAVEPIGSEATVHVDVAGRRFLVRADRRAPSVLGDEVGLAFCDGDVHRFAAADGADDGDKE
jgi:multiple sugar transport system ATP-binding protein